MEDIQKLIETIANESGKPLKEVAGLVEEKKEELSGLVSEEGAAYIVARELGVSLLKEGRRTVKAKHLGEGMRSVDFVGRVLSISDVREFEREGKKGRVLSLQLGDETGVVRLPLWNEEIDRVAELQIKEDDVLAISGGWVKMDNRGQPELRLGRGKIGKTEEAVEMPPKEVVLKTAKPQRMEIRDLTEGATAEVRACLVQLFRRDPFFEACPECGIRLFPEDGVFRCKEHGIVKAETRMVVAGVLDDGTGNIRAVFFREVAEKLFGETAKGLKQISQMGKTFLSIFDEFKSLGKDLIIRGRVKKNQFTGNLELIVSEIQDIDPRKEADRLLKQLKENRNV